MGTEMRLLLRILGNDSGLRCHEQRDIIRPQVHLHGQERVRRLRGTLSSIEGKLAGIGVTIVHSRQARHISKPGQGLTQITQTAGAARSETKGSPVRLLYNGKRDR
jgi:hypothetical protein